jgi:hypothetical protein
MTERDYVSRNVFLVAGLAAIVTFISLWFVGNAGRTPTKERTTAASERHRPAVTPAPLATLAKSRMAKLDLDEEWTPPPVEFVKTTAQVSLYNSRGKEVKQFPAGKRLRVNSQEGDQITIDYLGELYTIAAKSVVPSN